MQAVALYRAAWCILQTAGAYCLSGVRRKQRAGGSPEMCRVYHRGLNTLLWGFLVMIIIVQLAPTPCSNYEGPYITAQALVLRAATLNPKTHGVSFAFRLQLPGSSFLTG